MVFLMRLNDYPRAAVLQVCQYMGAASSGSLETLLNRTVMTSQMYYHQFLSTYTVGQGYKYVLGETNTMSVSIASGFPVN